MTYQEMRTLCERLARYDGRLTCSACAARLVGQGIAGRSRRGGPLCTLGLGLGEY